MIEQASLQSHNTLALAAKAERLSEPATLDALRDVLAEAKHQRWPVTVLGEGSNVVLAGDIPGLVIRPRLLEKEVMLDKPDYVLVAVGAGVHFDDLVQWTLAQGWQGLENLSLIPGTVGAAPVQNIGAYGVELADVMVWLDAMQVSSGLLQRLRNTECRFGYRDSLFKSLVPGAYVITRVCFKLFKQSAGKPLSVRYADLAERFAALPESGRNAHGVRDIVCDRRRAKLPDPALLPNAGSFFKNPEIPTSQAEALQQRYPALPVYPATQGRTKLAAGWLIEQSGFKGKIEGAVGMHDRQALVLVNHGGATGVEVLAFAARVRAAVHAHFGIWLEQEPVVLPVR